MAPGEHLQDFGSPSGTSKSERNRGTHMDKYPEKESILTHGDKNAQRVLVLYHLPLLYNA